MRLITVALVLTGLAACSDWSDKSQKGCIDDGDCSGTAICDLSTSTCQDVECLNSDQCALNHHCDTTQHTCVIGCAIDDDCLAGESCDDQGQCKSYGCRTTALDCSYGEVCQSGSCVHDSDPNCQLANDYGTQTNCVLAGGVLACFGTISGNSCVGDTYCILPCTVGGADCPRGTECAQAFQGDSTTYCIGDCPYLIAHGF